MVTSVGQAMAGHHFWFAAGHASLGLMIRMMTGAAYGMVFVLITQGLRRSLVVPAGMDYGLAVLVFSGIIGLPIAAKLTASGPFIADMAKMVGWSTLGVEHLLFGMVLGFLMLALSRDGSVTGRHDIDVESRPTVPD